MAIKLEDRPLDTVRQETIDSLIYNYSHGHITNEAFERRLDEVMEANNPSVMVRQIEDLVQPEPADLGQQKRAFTEVPIVDDVTKDEERIINVFGGSDINGPWVVPKSILNINIFGGATIDFSDAKFTTPEVTFKVFCIFGGGDIYVPEGVTVTSSTISIFGGLSNKAHGRSAENGPVIRVEGLMLFGGLNIKIKRTVKEKFMEFANQMRLLLGTQPRQ